MEIKQLLAIDYALFTVSDLFQSNQKSFPEYSIVFQSENDVFTGTFLQYDQYGPILTKLDAQAVQLKETISLSFVNEDKHPHFFEIRRRIFEIFKFDFHHQITEIINNPHLLLSLLIQIVQDIEIENTYTPVAFLNYRSLSNKIELPFKLITDNEYKVISLHAQN